MKTMSEAEKEKFLFSLNEPVYSGNLDSVAMHCNEMKNAAKTLRRAATGCIWLFI